MGYGTPSGVPPLFLGQRACPHLLLKSSINGDPGYPRPRGRSCDVGRRPIWMPFEQTASKGNTEMLTRRERLGSFVTKRPAFFVISVFSFNRSLFSRHPDLPTATTFHVDLSLSCNTRTAPTQYVFCPLAFLISMFLSQNASEGI